MLIEVNFQNLTQLFWTIIYILNLYVAFLLYRILKVYRAERQIILLETANIKEHIDFMRTRPNLSTSPYFSANGSYTTRSRFFEQFFNSEAPQLRSCMEVRHNFRSNSSTTAADADVDENADEECVRKQQQQNKRSKQQKTTQQQNWLQQKKHFHPNPAQQHAQPYPQCECILRKPQSQPQHTNYTKMIGRTSSEEATETEYNPKPDDEHTLYISDSFGRVVHEIPFRECDYMDALQLVLGDQRWKIKKAWNDRTNSEVKCKAKL